MIAVIDYKSGNLHSIVTALEKVGLSVKVSDRPEVISAASGIVLPGVGAFSESMRALARKNMISPLCNAVRYGVPLLGICVGMQLLFESGEEGGTCEGIGIFNGTVKKLDVYGGRKLHMGWNQLRSDDDWATLNGRWMYFAHAYAVTDYDPKEMKAACLYNNKLIPSFFQKGRVMATQFHPEKSGEDGEHLLTTFKEMCI